MYAKTQTHGSVFSPGEGRGCSSHTLKMALTKNHLILRIKQNSLCRSVLFTSQQEITDRTSKSMNKVGVQN